MTIRHGLRESDIARRETTIISWLGFFGKPMMARALTDMFTEGLTGPYANHAYTLTDAALGSLLKRQVIREAEAESMGVNLPVYGLAEPSSAANLDPDAVELTPREAVVMALMDARRNEAQTSAEIDRRFGQQESDLMGTEVCVRHLAALGLLQVVDSLPASYRLP